MPTDNHGMKEVIHMTSEGYGSRNVVAREHLMTGAFSAQIDRIEAHRIALMPGQRGGIHSHPGGVVGYIVDGEIIVEIAGHSPVTLRSGDVFYEPPGATISRFDNASDTATATFIAFYPLTGDQPLISMGGQ
ncbi:MAG: cupin domain-containing protein [Chloroflexota bacterium]|nr:cupin domain-containing protein [Chloroflexota bacterium]